MQAQPAVGLRCEYAEGPLAVHDPAPRLSWRLPAGGRQAAYRVVVDGLWDSGRVASSQSVGVAYGGAALPSRQRCVWRVRWWPPDGGAASAWSDDAVWEMGLLDPADWAASWISLAWPSDGSRPAPVLRREFSLDEGASGAARLYVSAHGLVDVRVNGAPVSADRFVPGWTEYGRRLHYRAYDVGALLRVGLNEVEAVLGEGWWCGYMGFELFNQSGPGRGHYGEFPEALVQVEVDGDVVVASDADWVGAFGAVPWNDLLLGERHDARRGLSAASVWAPVVVRPMDGVPLVGTTKPAVRVVEEAVPVAVDGDVVDMGQNMVGWVRLFVDEPAGTEVTMRFAEVRNPDGSLHTENLRAAQAVDGFVSAGEPAWFEPRFTFHGFRYVQVAGVSGGVRPERVAGCVAHTDLPRTGWFECSSPLVNRLVENIWWSQRGNSLDVPTDCPQRDERLGWTADAQVFAGTASYFMETAVFLDEWLVDLGLGQRADGAFADVAPAYRGMAGTAAPGWGDAGVLVPWALYRHYGDVRVVARHYEAARRWVDFVAGANPDGRWVHERGADYGDWLSVGSETPKDLVATAFFARSAGLVARMASVLGRADDAARYGALAERVRAAFVGDWVLDDGRLRDGTQTGYALALRFGLVPEPLRAAAGRWLAEDVQAGGERLTTGFLGVGHLLPALTQAGYTDVAYALLERTEFPSWGYCIERGATTVWERWDGYGIDGEPNDWFMNSFNHCSLGSVGEWLWSTVAGIHPGPAGGFQRFVVRPVPGGSLTWVDATHRSLYGDIVVRWERPEGGRGPFRLRVEVPPNTEAHVVLPDGRRHLAGPGAHEFY